MSSISKVFTEQPPELNKEEKARLNMIAAARTTPRDDRFPHTNQALHCWNRYNEWIVCAQQGSEDDCKPLRQYADSICPGAWLESWDEQREAGSFGGVGSRFDHKAH
ncbi:cytochrome c oxidase subunit 6b [Fistulifera solaris]|uniref:Cytochrome c oxidase subunit 6b n=1 Tax=Fistulifera solaris TaxID=1519565 RepID=A0A1Z5JA52_FISSO|nr:cytochrome c oxidase subunit 6b [Fistulifera solaris]|eukprot:GAX10865.1 cytochrome c oxidase subunit 6b [Fistulifera solaris]